SSGDEWRDRRHFNEQALDSREKLHRHHDAFKEIVSREVDQLTGQRSGELRWVDFQSLGERISHQVILGTGQVRPEMTMQLARMVRRSNLLLRHGPCFSAFYQQIERYLTRKEPAGLTACLMHESSG